MAEYLTEWQRHIERRLSALEKTTVLQQPKQPETLALTIPLPEADIGGLHFNRQEVKGVFDLKEDGAYYSRDILFCSARDTDEGTGRDLLSEYLEGEAVREAFLEAVKNHAACAGGVRVFLPEENQGVKKYNGVSGWYWLGRCSSGSGVFATVSCSGSYSWYSNASAVGGCAPAFRVGCG